MFNSSCLKDSDCLKNGECKFENSVKVCKCNTKERTVYKPDSEPYYQCSKNHYSTINLINFLTLYYKYFTFKGY
jgi:hypothetical protein